MNIDEAVKKACEQKTLVDALTYIVIWECDRAVQQALHSQGLYETCFEVCVSRVLTSWKLQN